MEYVAAVSAILHMTPHDILWNLSLARGRQAEMIETRNRKLFTVAWH